MNIENNLIGQNIVAIIRNINTSVFSQLWFVNNGIFKEECIKEDSVFAPGFIRVVTDLCVFEITRQSIRLIIAEDDQSRSYSIVKDVFAKFVEKADPMPIVAIGINFLWKLAPQDSNMKDAGDYMFGQGESRVYDYFNTPSARLGAYFSQKYDECTRIRLDIKPAFSDTEGNKEEFYVASFNYHWELAHTCSKKEIIEHTHKWSNMRQTSGKIVCLLK